MSVFLEIGIAAFLEAAFQVASDGDARRAWHKNHASNGDIEHWLWAEGFGDD